MTQDGDISKCKAQKGDVLPWVKDMEKAVSLGEGWRGGGGGDRWDRRAWGATGKGQVSF